MSLPDSTQVRHRRPDVVPTRYFFVRQFARIELLTKLQRDREIVGMYENNLADLREEIEKKIHKLGKLDERLGGDSV